MTTTPRTSWSDERGLSAVEMIVVFAIIGVIASLAMMGSTGGANKQFQRQNVARELKVAFERARFDSVKRHAEGAGPATVIVNASTYTLKTDLNQNGVFESSESVVSNFAGQDVTIAGYVSLSLPVTVSFNKRGEATAVDSTNATVAPQFLVCNGTCAQTPTASDANIVLVTPTGTVNLLAGNATVPTFANPNVTNVSTTTGISNTVSLP